MRSTNIADLRNRLTQYLQEVRAGEEIVVRDRQRPIAKIVPFTVDDEDADEAALVASGLMRKTIRDITSRIGLAGAFPVDLAPSRRCQVERGPFHATDRGKRQTETLPRSEDGW